jgi:hypothetical protein
MITQEELINDIKLLSDTVLQAVGIIVKEVITLKTTNITAAKPVYGSGKGMMWISDDFDEPLNELKEYDVI